MNARDEIDLEGAEPGEVYEAIKEMDEGRFEALMSEQATREQIIDALLAHMTSLFRPEEAKDLEATIHFKIWDRPGGGYDHFEMLIADRECELSEQPSTGAPRLTVKIAPVDLRKLLTGETGARRLALRRRLTVLGDLKLGMRLPDLFEL